MPPPKLSKPAAVLAWLKLKSLPVMLMLSPMPLKTAPPPPPPISSVKATAVTETEEISRGGLELHLFKLVSGTLVDVGDSTARLPLVRTLTVSVKQGDII